ncbi:MAG: sigma 54-interacting transcriptional regulator [Blastocatellia bacterium]|nr:sigma 54-interacting transcriptional regulator [Blastocatellia bacterium]
MSDFVKSSLPDYELRRYGALLAVSEAIASHRDLASLLQTLAQQLNQIVQCDVIKVVLYDADRNVMRLHSLESAISAIQPESLELPPEESPAGQVWLTQRPLLINDIEQLRPYPLILERVSKYCVRSLCILPLNSAGRSLGVLVFGSLEEAAYNECDVAFLEKVTGQVAIAVDNALNFEQAQTAQRQLAAQRDRSRLLLEVNNAVVSILDLKQLLQTVSVRLRETLHHDFAILALYEEETKNLRVHALDSTRGWAYLEENEVVPISETAGERAIANRETIIINLKDRKGFQSEFTARITAIGIKSSCVAPLISHNRALGILAVSSLRDNAFNQKDAELFSQVSSQVAIAVENALAFNEIETLKNKLASEKIYLEEEIQSQFNFSDIIGQSPSLISVFKQVEIVAPTDSTVLIQGETGAGKELIARAIHNLSNRRERTLVKVNCAAIPTGLLESELFGHERGAFTGAISQRIGRFELAHKGTLFLDEVGDIPLELQAKLLRVLQEGEFERLGSSRTQKVDVRLIAATNANLERMVANREFRSDLYYRLNVFPINMPPLRKRRGDIPLLVSFFAQKFARRFHKKIETIPAEAIARLEQYHWPGNVRELENFIERAVILSRGSELEIPLGELKLSNGLGTANAKSSMAPAAPAAPAVVDVPRSSTASLAESERDAIMRALRDANWVVGGANGAAARLALKRTTLISRMKKLGINREVS